MLTGHRRHLMRQAGPTAGEVETGEVTPIIGAFSDATLFEDPWTPPSGTASAWEPAMMARASGGDRPYRGEAIPYMLGGVVGGVLGGPVGVAAGLLGVGALNTGEVGGPEEDSDAQARPVLAARQALKDWAFDNRVPVTADWGGTSPNQEIHAYGSVLILRSANDRIEAAQAARRIARLRSGVFYNMSPLGSGRVLVYFSEDPAGFLIQGAPKGVPAVVYAGNIFGKLGDMLKRSPEKKKARLAALEAKYKSIQSGEGQAGPFQSAEGLLRKINRLRGELGMQPLSADAAPEGEKTESKESTEGYDETGRFFAPRRVARRVTRRAVRRGALLRPYRPLPLRPILPLRPLVVVRRRALWGGPPPVGPVGVPMEGSAGSSEDD